MIRAIVWKEWHEHRAKYLTYWLLLNAPVLILALAIVVSSTARVPFGDLSPTTVLKYLPLALSEAILVVTLFLFITGYLAVATFSPEIEDGSIFFIHEQPISRKRYVALKLLIGGIHVVIAVSFAILFATLVVWVLMLASGKITWAGSGSAFGEVMSASIRSMVWCSLISLAAFAGSALISALVPRWWLAAGGSVVLTAGMIYLGADFFSFLPDIQEGTMSIGFNIGTGHANWLNVSRALHDAEIRGFGPWKPLPLLTAIALTAAFSVAIAVIYERRQIK